MRLTTGLLIAGLCAAPMIASATGFTPRDTSTLRPGFTDSVITNPPPVSVPEPGTLALLLAGLGGAAAARGGRRNDRKDR